jgi:hypothetical protein
LQAEHHEVMQVQQFLEDARQNEAWERRRHLSAGFRLAKRIMLEQQGKFCISIFAFDNFVSFILLIHLLLLL